MFTIASGENVIRVRASQSVSQRRSASPCPRSCSTSSPLAALVHIYIYIGPCLDLFVGHDIEARAHISSRLKVWFEVPADERRRGKPARHFHVETTT